MLLESVIELVNKPTLQKLLEKRFFYVTFITN